ncbi:hypothetical protein SERLA73DRAFT_125200 [Serpula lacrymans var. lacrymans S7.3]|uniref:Uncharacterized protein n=2 Tax=Serpula lacrymans var. lacrymans TaxID=341189 RepID=F8Q6Z0_SERL3|nr:uncharacterized protein SERLADRAFT_474972 [Serpula lacrymans var. lacrymans S7.9]EGN96378.1 hypothetical protein SERLA73DRAFT_125200 [Serpula lacrymans var. lacrymans S7.3]EGO21916.1 hypothetical protein SERLADRAFT_474972 [Serpula lacrymans var. lacrymans S7.9]
MNMQCWRSLKILLKMGFPKAAEISNTNGYKCSRIVVFIYSLGLVLHSVFPQLQIEVCWNGLHLDVQTPSMWILEDDSRPKSTRLQTPHQ